MNKLYFILIFLLGCSFINYKVYNSYVLQVSVINEFNNSEVLQATFDKIKDFDITIPNITSTTLPFSGLKANYFYRFGDLTKALEILNETNNDNPFWFFNEYLKSSIYSDLGFQDSSYYYSKIASNGLPNNIVHFEKHAINIARNGDIDDLNSTFLKVNSSDPTFFRIYLGVLLNMSDSFNYETKKIIKSNLEFNYKDDEIYFMSNAVLYGKINIDSSSVISKNAEKDFNLKNYDKSIEKYLKAISLFPGDYSYFENLSLSYYLNGNYKKSLTFINQAIDSFPSRNDGKAEYIKALSLIKLGDNSEACSLLRISTKRNFIQAHKLLLESCK
ncbi:hypothetical protein OAC73_01435 [Flavobacteriaceae bacterium]|nr:hypothetical protein [Flavobacteriaceae bacterium]